MDFYSIWMVIFFSSLMCLYSCIAQTNPTEVSTDMGVTTLCCDEASSTEASADETSDVGGEMATTQTKSALEASPTGQISAGSNTTDHTATGHNATVHTAAGQTTTPSDPAGEPEGESTSAPEGTTKKSGSALASPSKYWAVLSFVSLIVMTAV